MIPCDAFYIFLAVYVPAYLDPPPLVSSVNSDIFLPGVLLYS